MLTFLLALISGYATNYIEPSLKTFLKARFPEISLESNEYRLLTAILLLFVVALFGFLANESVPAFVIILGGGIGLFGMQLFNAGKAFLDNRTKLDDE